MSIAPPKQVDMWLLGLWPSPIRSIESSARRIEDAGWDGYLLADAQNQGPDPYVLLGVAAAATSRLKMGTGVTNPVTRHPAVVATAINTVQAISGGRAMLGIGRGDGALATLGLRPASVDAFTAYLDRLQAYLRGASVSTDGVESRLSYLDDEPIPKVPIDVAATGPRMLGIGATHAEMVSFAVGAVPERVEYCMGVVAEARRSAGLDPRGIATSCYVPVAVTTGSSMREARHTIRKSASIFARFSAMGGRPLDSVAASEEPFLARMSEQFEGPGGHPSLHSDSVIDDDEFLDRFAVVGSARHCAERLQQLIDLGLDRLVLITRSFGTDPADGMSARVAQEVLPLLDREMARPAPVGPGDPEPADASAPSLGAPTA